MLTALVTVDLCEKLSICKQQVQRKNSRLNTKYKVSRGTTVTGGVHIKMNKALQCGE